jgi:hypothetical protein
VTLLDRFDAKIAALREWFNDTDPPSYGIAHGFALANPMDEANLHRIEEEAGVALPAEYRSFLLRFGDGEVGPGWYHRLRKGLTPASNRPFPLTKPFLGCCSPAHQRLSKDAQWEDFRQLSSEWDRIPKHDGVLAICDYGCAMHGVLILNGPLCGRVWMLSGDAAYFGPFGGSEGLHDEYTPSEWEPTDTPKDYSFLEWYESWLDGQLTVADLADH